MKTPRKDFVIGVDVGTGSVRAALFDLKGRMISHAQRPIHIWNPEEHFVEQSSDDIWSAACHSVRAAVREAKVPSASVVGISFDATCSLVALGSNDRPVTVSPTGKSRQNIIVWMDHRAMSEAVRINEGEHEVLRYVGGKISPEQEPPKLLWLKEHLPDSWRKARKFFDLADFMTYKSTGVDVRSLCTLVCKWGYLGHENRWDRSFYEILGLGDLFEGEKIGRDVRSMGSFIGRLTPKAASQLNLSSKTKVAAGIIDAHAGGIGLIGSEFETVPGPADLGRILALIGGTSSCHMALSPEPRFIPGVWGPYFGAMAPGMWLNEGGQSATGSLIDFIVAQNDARALVQEKARKKRLTIYKYLNGVVLDLKRKQGKGPEIVKDVNVLPYFLGNRSPRADPSARGIVAGLTLDESEETIARNYYATIQAIAYGTRHIIEELNAHGYAIDRIYACGGGTKNELWLQEHADITGLPIILPRESEAVLLGTSMLAAVGAGKYASILEAAVKMGGVGRKYLPQKGFADYHKAKYTVFQMMYGHLQEYRNALSRF